MPARGERHDIGAPQNRRAPRRTRRALASTAVLVAVLVVGEGPSHGARTTCGNTPAPEVAAEPDGWPLANRDLTSSRAQLDTRIGTETVDELEQVWSYDVPGDPVFGNLTTTPIVSDGTVYVGALDGSVHAVDLDDGTRRWAVERDVSVFGPSGAAIGHGKVFGISGPAVVAAHDVDDGTVLWTRDLAVAAGNQVDMQPVVHGGCVLISTQALSPGSRGTIYALDEATGDVVWQIETVPDDFWGDPTRNHGGGAWYPPVVDVERGRTYWGTSNPWPSPGAPGFPAGASRPGDNLYTNSLLALDLDDGDMDWYHQVFPHDIWDRDMVLTQLVELDDGRDVVVHTGKGGRVLAYDPDTGEVLWDVEVGMHLNDHLTTFTQPTTVMPGVLGGVETPPAAADGVVYLSVMNAPTTYDSPEQRFNLSVALGSNPGQLIALDATDGTTLWSTDLPGDALGGATVAGDLVFTSTFQGLLLAYDRATGAEVWRHEAGGPVNGWPAVVGDTILFPISGTTPSRLVAFRLPPAPPTSTSSSSSSTTTSTTTSTPGATSTTTTSTASGPSATSSPAPDDSAPSTTAAAGAAAPSAGVAVPPGPAAVAASDAGAGAAAADAALAVSARPAYAG